MYWVRQRGEREREREQANYLASTLHGMPQACNKRNCSTNIRALIMPTSSLSPLALPLMSKGVVQGS